MTDPRDRSPGDKITWRTQRPLNSDATVSALVGFRPGQKTIITTDIQETVGQQLTASLAQEQSRLFIADHADGIHITQTQPATPLRTNVSSEQLARTLQHLSAIEDVDAETAVAEHGVLYFDPDGVAALQLCSTVVGMAPAEVTARQAPPTPRSAPQLSMPKRDL